MSEHPIGTVTAVMHDTEDLTEAVEFWTTLLGLDVLYRDETYAYLSPMSEGGPHLAFQQVPEPKSGKNRLHLDLRVPERAAFERRVESLGGKIVAEHDEPGWPTWTLMADPQGNEFCIYERPDE